eukprot:TRINITY_DN13244_c0_g2_i2.p1 TRINITY_DN13244_c0_g2~~TRINITY_DN13244_c0_g2_i2.p1  ORF type:complete len:233 (+),score=17.32 TRINITY_DN13244_c0_g2_i2:63-761(+)
MVFRLSPSAVLSLVAGIAVVRSEECSGMNQKCGDSSSCTGMGSVCGAGSTCSGLGSVCGSKSICTGMGTKCGSDSKCSGMGATCGPNSCCTDGAICEGGSTCEIEKPSPEPLPPKVENNGCVIDDCKGRSTSSIYGHDFCCKAGCHSCQTSISSTESVLKATCTCMDDEASSTALVSPPGFLASFQHASAKTAHGVAVIVAFVSLVSLVSMAVVRLRWHSSQAVALSEEALG